MEMKQLVDNFSKQLSEALQIGRNSKIQPSKNSIQNIVISGLGGSGIGGSIVSQLVEAECSAPITIIKGYFLPAFVGKNTLLIISSYSGNTEETLNAMQMGIEKGAQIVAITSGGKVEEICQKNGFDFIKVPAGFPPRSCLGYSLTQLFFILKSFGLIKLDFENALEKSILKLENFKSEIQDKAKHLATFLENKMPVIYCEDRFEAVAVRFRQQINENSKVLCWHHVIPEMNHNELVGWTSKNENLAVVIFRNESDYFRNNARIEINKTVIEKYTSNLIEIYSEGETDLERAIYLIHLGDWASCYLADLRGVDAVEINVINHLKNSLAGI